ncbi:MAG: 6-carboxytetrahydropterin synthase QueD [Phycisphaerae bacterium]|nr:6-carboxytetrahydropterin synthase QueD [Phycisphaerae bacterium]
MQAELIKTFRFEAAHHLVGVAEAHKCRRLHGHSYRVDVHVTGEVDAASGMVMDFGLIVAAVKPLMEQLDHRLLNEIAGLENSTSELIARYIWDRVKPQLPGLSALTIWESDTARCVFRGT